MRNYWPLFLALTCIAHAQNNNTVPDAQKSPKAVSPSVKPSEEVIHAQDYGQTPGTCKTTTTVYDYGQPSTSTIRITVTAPMTCPSPRPSTLTRTITTTIAPSRGYEVLPPPVTVTVTKTTSVANGGGYGPPAKTVTITSVQSCSIRPPKTITETKSSTTTKVHLITLLLRGVR